METNPKRSPVVWLTVYEAAKRRGDDVLKKRARRQLKRLGVVVEESARRGKGGGR